MLKRSIFLLVTIFSVALCAQNSPDHENFSLESLVEQETFQIDNTSSSEAHILSDLYCSRGESYLLLGEDQKAFADFRKAYIHALNCTEKNIKTSLTFRSAFGAFLVYARMEDLEKVKSTAKFLEDILKNYSCHECKEMLGITTPRSFCFGMDMPCFYQQTRQDWPVLGPDYASVGDCVERVNGTISALTTLIAVVKKTEVRALAAMVINGLGDQARNCCVAGGLWKGCIQKLVNKLHYWKAYGIPADPSWDD